MSPQTKPGRVLTLAQLQSEKHWPYGRVHTARLVKAGKCPPPFKAVEGRGLNLWDEDEFDRFWAARREARKG